MSRDELSALVRVVMPHAERILPVGYSIAVRFPQFEYMADVRSRGRDYVVGIRNGKCYMHCRGTSLDI